MATKKSSSTSAKKGRGKVKKVMGEYKRGQLKSGGKKKVTSKKQAVAIALSEARQSGAKIPKKKGSAKKSSARKGGAKKSATKRKSSAKKRS